MYKDVKFHSEVVILFLSVLCEDVVLSLIMWSPVMFSRQINAQINAWLLNPYIRQNIFPSESRATMQSRWGHSESTMSSHSDKADAICHSQGWCCTIQNNQNWGYPAAMGQNCMSKPRAGCTNKEKTRNGGNFSKGMRGKKLDFFSLFQQHVTISSFYLKAICFYPKPSHSCKLQPVRGTRAETFISCRRCLKYSPRFVLSTR